MTLSKGPNGIWEGDFRFQGVPRLHLSMRTPKKAEAEPRYQAVRRLFREAKGAAGADRRALIEDLRVGRISIERIEAMVRDGEPLVPAEDSVPASDNAEWPTVDVAIGRYLDWIEANPRRRPATWRAARARLKRFAEFVFDGERTGDLTLDAVRSERLEAYQHTLLAAKTPPNSVMALMSRVGALWSWVQRRENRAAQEGRRLAVILHSPIDPETAPREVTRRDRWLTYAEAEALLEATPVQLRAAVGLGLFAGLRVGEALTLRPADIDLTLGTLAVAPKQTGVDASGRPVLWKPKTKRGERVVPIAAPLRPLLEHHLATYASPDWLMPAIENPGEPYAYWTFRLSFARIVADAELVSGRADPRGVVYHTLRHTFASWLVQRGVDLYTVAQLLGDTLSMVESTYAHLAPDFKKRAIAALEGAVRMPATAERE